MEEKAPSKTTESPLSHPSTVRSLASQALSQVLKSRNRPTSGCDAMLLNRLCDAVCHRSSSEKDGAVELLLSSGVSPIRLVDTYAAEAARQLGADWCDDTRSFAEVSLGSARLQALIRAHGRLDRTTAHRTSASLAVFVPGSEQHTIGSLILTQQLRRHGFSVRLIMGRPDNELLSEVQRTSFDAIFLSVSSFRNYAPLERLVRKLRTVARQDAPIVLGGPTLSEMSEEAVSKTGVDFATDNMAEALRFCGLDTLVRLVSTNGFTPVDVRQTVTYRSTG